MQPNNNPPILPKRIILLRHGESKGNTDAKTCTTMPDNKIPLTEKGMAQAWISGAQIRDVISCNNTTSNWKVYFYVSPYQRTLSTLRELGLLFSRNEIIGVNEDCRLREQAFGNFQEENEMKEFIITRKEYGRFFYQFPDGESTANVSDRVSGFLESLWRDIDMKRLHHDPSHDLNLIIVSHGLTARVFLMKWFKWTVEQFERLNNLGNCEFRVIELGNGGEYSLAIHHTEEEMQEWGLDADMIADQKWRANAHRGEWNGNCPWYLKAFFDHLDDSDDNEDSDNEFPSDSSSICA